VQNLVICKIGKFLDILLSLGIELYILKFLDSRLFRFKGLAYYKCNIYLYEQ